MKLTRVFRILAAAFLPALSVITIPAAPALADGENITLRSNQGAIGQEITISGNGFFASNTTSRGVNILFGKYPDATIALTDFYTLNTYEKVQIAEISPNGTGTFKTTFFVPARLTGGNTKEDVATGSYYIYVTYFYPINPPVNDTHVLQIVPFAVVVAAATVSPDNGTVGSEANINGTYFGNTEAIGISYDSNVINLTGNGVTSSNGTFGPAKITIPPGTAGQHIIIVSGNSSGTKAQATFTVKPKITIAPTSGASGTPIKISGSGFGNQLYVTPTFGGDSLTSGRTDGNGSFTFNIAALKKPAGSYVIAATDENGNSDQASFLITEATLNLSPNTGIAGTQVTASGSNLLPKKPISVTFNDVKVASATSDAQGAFSATFAVPALPTGTYKVKVNDGTNTNQSDFTIPARAAISPETSPASPGHVGSQITITGDGFIPGATLTVSYDSKPAATAKVKDDRSFSATFNAPASGAGEHAIIASDGTNDKKFTFVMEATPPKIPEPLKPEMKLKAKARTYFDWEDVLDESGVTYNLQVATKDDFAPANIVFEKTGLTKSEYTLTADEKLTTTSKEVPYYWRVKAVDGAANQSQWSGTGEFFVTGFLGFSQSTIYILIGIAALALAIFGFWLGRRTSYY